MKTKKLKRLSVANLITGYVMMGLFIILIMLNRSTDVVAEPSAQIDDDPDGLFDGKHNLEPEKEIVYVNRDVLVDRSIGPDRLDGVILDDDPDVIVIRDDVNPHVAVVGNSDHVVLRDRDDTVYIDNDRDVSIIGNSDTVYNRNVHSDHHIGRTVVGGDHASHHHDRVLDRDIGVVDVPALDLSLIHI